MECRNSCPYCGCTESFVDGFTSEEEIKCVFDDN